MQKSFSFTFEGQEQDAFIIAEDISQPPTFVLIHGAGAGTKERILTYADALVQAGISMLAFDQSGAGKDKDNLKKSSLERRTKESIYAIEQFASKEPLTLCGSSMGGEVAIRLLGHFPVKNLILFCPAIYDEKAFTLKFGEGFTDIISQPESWKNSVTPSMLEKFEGNLLIVIGELDTVIPAGVIEVLDTSAKAVKKKEIFRIPGCPHRYQEWLSKHPDIKEKVTQKVLEFSQ